MGQLAPNNSAGHIDTHRKPKQQWRVREMDYHELTELIRYPEVDLIRSDNAPMVIGFLFRAFRAQHRTSLAEGHIRAALEVYLEEIRAADPSAYPMSAAQYLATWCDSSHQYLRKYLPDDAAEAVFELTSGSERAILWMEQLHGSTGFVGTESRLDSIFKGLDDLLENTTTDVNVRIQHLESEMQRIQGEIDRIRATGVVPTYTPVQINERFAHLIATARELLGDFRRVEENFKRIAQDIAEQHAIPGVKKGTIVANMLDAEEALRKSEQGQSFYAFWDLLLNLERQRQFQAALERVLDLKDLNERLKNNALLVDLTRHLLQEGEKVLNSGQRMATNLRRVLDSTRSADRLRILDLVKEIHALAVPLRPRPPEGAFFDLPDYPEFFNAMNRSLFEKPASVSPINSINEAPDEMRLDDLRKLASLPFIDVAPLQRNVAECLETDSTITLEEVLDKFPPEHGMLQILGYIMVALGDPKHFISQEEERVITVSGDTRWKIPRIFFCK